MSDHGAMRSQHGTKPLYKPKKPSFEMVFIKQSIELLYVEPGTEERNEESKKRHRDKGRHGLPVLGWFMIRAFTTSAGVPKVAPTNLKKCHFSDKVCTTTRDYFSLDDRSMHNQYHLERRLELPFLPKPIGICFP